MLVVARFTVYNNFLRSIFLRILVTYFNSTLIILFKLITLKWLCLDTSFFSLFLLYSVYTVWLSHQKDFIVYSVVNKNIATVYATAISAVTVKK